MQCTKCGKELPADAAFCFACGAPQTTQLSGMDAPTKGPGALSAYQDRQIELMRRVYGKTSGEVNEATVRYASRPIWTPAVSPVERGTTDSDLWEEGFWASRSKKLAVVVIAFLALGLVFLFTMPVVTASSTETDFVTGNSVTTHKSGDYGQVEAFMNLAGGEWAVIFLWVGLVAAVGAAVVLPNTQRQLRSFVVTAGSVAMMAFPFWVSTHQKIMGASIGSGTVLAWIAFVFAALASWVL